MTQYIEDVLPPIMDAGLNTLENTTIGGTLAVTGASTFTGAVSFATNPTFTGGQLENLVTVSAATGTNPTLTVAQSGSTVLVTSTSGTIITLPVPTAGLSYDFAVLTKPTTGNVKVITNSGSVFLVGGVVTASTTNASLFVADGTSHVAITMNGTTTGGTVGTNIRTTCISSTQWVVDGQNAGSGVIATPFATS